MKNTRKGKVSGSAARAAAAARTVAGAASKARTVVEAKAAQPASREVYGKATATATGTKTTTVKVTSGKEQTIYIYIRYVGGSIVGLLYAIGIPKPLLLQPANPSNTAAERPKQISPILTFSREKYPLGMRCVKYESKLYFVGGEFYGDRGSRGCFPPDVHIFDTTITTTNPAASAYQLEKGTRMNTGKRDPLAFVFEGKIYVLSGLGSYVKIEKLSRFECFDPESDKWIVLDEPPTKGSLIAYAIVRCKVFVLEHNCALYCFNLRSNKWDSATTILGLPRLRVPSLDDGFYHRAEFVEDTLYGENQYGRILAYGPLSESSEEAEEEVFDHPAFLSLDMGTPSRHRLTRFEPSSCLTHLGNRRFCRVVINSPSDPKYQDLPDPKKRNISIMIFQALRDTYQNGRENFFRAELLHSAHFVSTSSSPLPVTGFIDGGFCVPW